MSTEFNDWKRGLQQFKAIVIRIPRHLADKNSWRELRKHPVRCLLYVVSPAISLIFHRKASVAGRDSHNILRHVIDLTQVKTTVLTPAEWLIDSGLSTKCTKSEEAHLGALFEMHGSDKDRHGYSSIYQAIITSITADSRTQSLIIAEIGIGSNDPRITSNMGVFGSPGASLRAFRDFAPLANVIGGDVDSRVMFSEERIRTFVVNQLDETSVKAFVKNTGNFNLIIDDGLHELGANLTTLKVATRAAQPGAWIVIEDINPMLEKEWHTVWNLLDTTFRCWVVRATTSLLFIAQKR